MAPKNPNPAEGNLLVRLGLEGLVGVGGGNDSVFEEG